MFVESHIRDADQIYGCAGRISALETRVRELVDKFKSSEENEKTITGIH